MALVELGFGHAYGHIQVTGIELCPFDDEHFLSKLCFYSHGRKQYVIKYPYNLNVYDQDLLRLAKHLNIDCNEKFDTSDDWQLILKSRIRQHRQYRQMVQCLPSSSRYHNAQPDIWCEVENTTVALWDHALPDDVTTLILAYMPRSVRQTAYAHMPEGRKLKFKARVRRIQEFDGVKAVEWSINWSRDHNFIADLMKVSDGDAKWGDVVRILCGKNAHEDICLGIYNGQSVVYAEIIGQEDNETDVTPAEFALPAHLSPDHWVNTAIGTTGVWIDMNQERIDEMVRREIRGENGAPRRTYFTQGGIDVIITIGRQKSDLSDIINRSMAKFSTKELDTYIPGSKGRMLMMLKKHKSDAAGLSLVEKLGTMGVWLAT